MSTVDQLRALSAKKADSESFKAAYGLCKDELRAMGWTDEHMAELAEILAVDLAEGPGVERPFPMTLEERRACWRNWFAFYIIHTDGVAGIQQRIEARILLDRGLELQNKEFSLKD